MKKIFLITLLIVSFVAAGKLHAQTTTVMVPGCTSMSGFSLTTGQPCYDPSDTAWNELHMEPNQAYPNSSFQINTVHQKIGSFLLQNNTGEAITISKLQVGIETGTDVEASDFSNLQVFVDSTQVGSTINSPTTRNEVDINKVIASQGSFVVDIYADLGSQVGHIQTALGGQGIGATSGSTYINYNTFGNNFAASGQVIQLVEPLTNNLNLGALKSSIASLTPLTISKSLSFGESDPEVATLQQYLITNGYLSSSATGYYGMLTKAAVQKLQSDLGITSDGSVVGPRTRAALAKISVSEGK